MIESIPNVSEGRDHSVIGSMTDTLESVENLILLNVSSDQDHNRTVFTYASESDEALEEASKRLWEIAIERIDLRTHTGEHPRIGAVDVMPFVPLRGSTMDDCVALAGRVGSHIAEKFDVPVFLYERSATADHRRALPAIRSGQFEALGEKMRHPDWRPDFGPASPHPSAGATVIGARGPLIAFNVQLETDRIEVADKIARKVREVSGGLQFVRALPIRLLHRGIVQVSMNLVDYTRTPIHRAFDLVGDEAARHGVEVLSTEIVGLVPADALDAAAEWYLLLEGFRSDVVLERRLEERLKAGD